MKDWIKRVLGSPREPQTNEEPEVVVNYVVVKKDDLEALLDELQQLRAKADPCYNEPPGN
jgi:hypothetical protein